MQKSEEIGELIKGLAEFHKEVEQPKKDASNPHFNSEYVTLDEIIRVVDKVAVQHGIIYTQEVITQDGAAGVTTTIWHTSGQYISFEPVILPSAKQTPQQYGSSITYARRYSLSAAFGLASEPDDDGNAGSEQKGNNGGGKGGNGKPNNNNNNNNNNGNKGRNNSGQGKTQQGQQNGQSGSQQNNQKKMIDTAQQNAIQDQAKKLAKIRGGQEQRVYEHLGIGDLKALTYEEADNAQAQINKMVAYAEDQQAKKEQAEQEKQNDEQDFNDVANNTQQSA